MSYTQGDDTALDAEIEGRKARRVGLPRNPKPYNSHDKDEETKLNKAWRAGWDDEDKLLSS